MSFSKNQKKAMRWLTGISSCISIILWTVTCLVIYGTPVGTFFGTAFALFILSCVISAVAVMGGSCLFINYMEENAE